MNRPGCSPPGCCWSVIGGCCHTTMPNLVHPGPRKCSVAQRCGTILIRRTRLAPAVVGVRPREYDKPPPEPSRGRWYLGNWEQQ